jgi:regulator of protease activity HflC (stomatin/prohibitin superfamily)
VRVVDSVIMQFKNSVPEPIWNILVFVGAIATVVWTVIRSFVFVQPGRVGIRKRFGKPILKYPKMDMNGRGYTKAEIEHHKAVDEARMKAYKPAIYGRPHDLHPGFNALLPFVHSVEIIDVRQNNIRLNTQRIVDLKNYVAYELPVISISIFLKDVYLWLMASIDAEEQVRAIADTALSTILREYSHEQVLSNDPAINRRFAEVTSSELAELGVLLEGDALKLGSVNMNVEATFRSNAQREIAQAITASGNSHKTGSRWWRGIFSA